MNINKGISGEITWHSPSNIALVKYWGKKANQVPENPSLSFSLNNAITKTSIKYQAGTQDLKVKFIFENKENKAFEARIERYLQSLITELPWLDDLELIISSSNTFPHSAGIASSAAAMSSLALSIQTIQYNLEGLETGTDEFLATASHLARLASGSASRSVYGGFTTWGKIDNIKYSSDSFASPLPFMVHPSFTGIRDAILIIDSGEKEISSSKGHALMKDHPFAGARYSQAQSHIILILEALAEGDWDLFTRITELEALTLHALLMSSGSGITLMKPASLSVIDKIREFRKQQGLPVCFTLDAGPNIHLLYPENIEKQVKNFIEKELVKHCQAGQWIDDSIGAGPKLIQNSFIQ